MSPASTSSVNLPPALTMNVPATSDVPVSFAFSPTLFGRDDTSTLTTYEPEPENALSVIGMTSCPSSSTST